MLAQGNSSGLNSRNRRHQDAHYSTIYNASIGGPINKKRRSS
jgi:hypothetical protein